MVEGGGGWGASWTKDASLATQLKGPRVLFLSLQVVVMPDDYIVMLKRSEDHRRLS